MSWQKKTFDFDAWVSRLRKAHNPAMKKHVFLGVARWTGDPIMLPDNLLSEHVWVTGGSGSGKSALILAPLAAQIIAKRDRSVVFIDQKNDPASFWNCFDAAHQHQLPFKYFSLTPGHESYLYNPLRQKIHDRLTPTQRAELFAQCAGMDYGDAYGASFFLAKSELALANYLSHFTNPPIDDCIQFFKLFNDKSSYAAIGHVEDWADASHLRALFARLASISSLNATPSTLPSKPAAHEAAMEMFELLRTPTVYYFNLPASMGRNSARFIARSVLQHLFASAGVRGDKESVGVSMICDEFQESVGPSIDILLEQGRSRGISFVLAHQSIDQLDRNGVNLLPVLQSCTSTHIVVEATDANSVEYIQKRSGQAYFAVTSWSQQAPSDESPSWFGADWFRAWKAMASDGVSTPLVNVREELQYRIDQNLIRKVSADPTAAFIAIKKNSGCANFDGFMIPMQSYFHIDRNLFAARNSEPWPTWKRPETVIVQLAGPMDAAAAKPLPDADIQIVPGPSAVDSALQDRLNKRGRNRKSDQA